MAEAVLRVNSLKKKSSIKLTRKAVWLMWCQFSRLVSSASHWCSYLYDTGCVEAHSSESLLCHLYSISAENCAMNLRSNRPAVNKFIARVKEAVRKMAISAKLDRHRKPSSTWFEPRVVCWVFASFRNSFDNCGGKGPDLRIFDTSEIGCFCWKID